jgi:ATP-dependent helicase/nuclease subunit A
MSLQRLIPDQLSAVMPGENIWLSASAGTGKTQVLTARVIRLLLEEQVEPENLLCITFTKAGAAEMAERINQRLAAWVQMPDKMLFHDLEAIGAKSVPEARTRARRLFAKVLDAPGGGLQIMTIHGFCQSLLASFPEEAGLIPGFKPVEGREQQELQREALSEMILAAEVRGDDRLIRNLQSLSLAMGEAAARHFLHKCAGAPDVMAGIPDDQGAVTWARNVAGVSFAGAVEAFLERELADDRIERAAIESIAAMNLSWGKGQVDSRGGKRATAIHNWLASTPAQRAASFDMLHVCWTSSKGEPMIASRGYTPTDPTYAAVALELHEWTKSLSDEVCRAHYAERLAQALLVGKAFAGQYAKSKHALGVVDFDDMIRRTADLLHSGHMADWVRYKLDRQIDHILVDEAQDTNKAQWDIIRALSDDFYSGAGARAEKTRTIFAVGDFKQAIYGFQGTAPERYREAGEAFAQRIAEAERELQNLALSQSFRSTAPILDFVNAVIATTGPENFGISDVIEDHYSAKGDFGLVELLSPVTPASIADEAAANDNIDDEENWITSEKRALATKFADYAKALIDERPWLETQGRHLQPGDIMFLLRTRGDLASLLVAQLHERGVPVAGIDRLRLLQPLVVQDLLAAIRFVLQPGDDLSLACILVSPLIGWDQDRLLRHGYRGDGKKTLWQHLREQSEIAGELAPLHEMLAIADFTTVYHFLEQILSGVHDGRRKFAARLGPEALVPCEEMLGAAMQFEQQRGGGLQAFLAWFDRGDIEIKRDGESGANEVRVMTVHGAKGLQSPVVILADTTSDPGQKPDRSAELIMDEGKRTPLLPIRKHEQSGRLGAIVDMQKERETQEHKRLLYVAMTRAEERLVMGGALGARSNGVAPEASWFAALRSGMETLGGEWQDDRRFGQVMRHVGGAGDAARPKSLAAGVAATQAAEKPDVPDWLFQSAPDEGRPPRPLVPSRLEDDDYGDAPAALAMRAAAERGKLIHALFERVTDVPALANAEAWLDHVVTDLAIDKTRILADVRGIVANPDWRDFFGPHARAEVPLAAVVGETVISGRIDRLVVEPGLVRILDFKTGRSVPADANAVAVPYLRQMAHYVAALQTIFPDARVEAALLFTFAPKLILLPDAILAPHKPAC